MGGRRTSEARRIIEFIPVTITTIQRTCPGRVQQGQEPPSCVAGGLGTCQIASQEQAPNGGTSREPTGGWQCLAGTLHLQHPGSSLTLTSDLQATASVPHLSGQAWCLGHPAWIGMAGLVAVVRITSSGGRSTIRGNFRCSSYGRRIPTYELRCWCNNGIGIALRRGAGTSQRWRCACGAAPGRVTQARWDCWPRHHWRWSGAPAGASRGSLGWHATFMTIAGLLPFTALARSAAQARGTRFPCRSLPTCSDVAPVTPLAVLT